MFYEIFVKNVNDNKSQLEKHKELFEDNINIIEKEEKDEKIETKIK